MVLLLIKIIFTLIGICLANIVKNPYSNRIIGGHNAEITDYPYQVLIQFFDSEYYCGGTIYNSKVIVTAAHCVNEVDPSDILVRAGSSFRNNGGVIVKVEKVITSKLWNDKTLDSDVGVLILKENLQMSKNIKSIELATEEPKLSEIAHISGWGFTQTVQDFDDMKLPEKLQAIEIPIFDWNECNKIYNGKLTENMFCAGLSAGGKDSCYMDSGGPLVINNQLFGIVSFGKLCGVPNSPGVYVKVKNYVKWINEVSKLKE